jgi:hypothetical protein
MFFPKDHLWSADDPRHKPGSRSEIHGSAKIYAGDRGRYTLQRCTSWEATQFGRTPEMDRQRRAEAANIALLRLLAQAKTDAATVWCY